MKLSDLMKKFGLTAKEESVAVDLKDTPELHEMLAAFDEKETALSAALEQVNELTTQMSQFKEQAAKAEADAKQEKLDARLAALSKDVGDERASAVLAATEGLDDVQFEAIAQALKLSADNEAKTELFTEGGVEGDVKPDAHAEETLEMKKLKAKYPKAQ